MRFITGCFALSFVFGALASCADPEVLAELKALGEGCLLDSDCEGDLVCVFRKCHYQCVETKDCTSKPGAPVGVLCVKGDKPTNVCQLDVEVPCQNTAQCPGDQVCGADHHCRDQCTATAECLVPQVCVKASCVEPDEITAGTFPVDEPGTEGSTCTYSSECDGTLTCKGGVCVYECLTTKDCPYGFSCAANVCTPNGGGGSGGGGAGGGGAGGGGAGGGSGGGGAGGGGVGGGLSPSPPPPSGGGTTTSTGGLVSGRRHGPRVGRRTSRTSWRPGVSAARASGCASAFTPVATFAARPASAPVTPTGPAGARPSTTTSNAPS